MASLAQRPIAAGSASGPAGPPAADGLGFRMPELDPLYVQREEGYVGGLVRQLTPGLAGSAGSSGGPATTAAPGVVRCLALVGGAGLGKSSLALDVGRRLWESGAAAGVAAFARRPVCKPILAILQSL